MTKREQYTRILNKYLPEEFVPHVLELFIKHPVKFRISKPRKTKLGDYKHNPNGAPTISVNGDLNKYAFLVTTIHEFAHLVTFKEHGVRVKPHGKEWQFTYSMLMKPIIESDHLPEELTSVLINSLINVKASSCSDKNLHRILRSYDEHIGDLHLLEDLEKNSIFKLNGREFTKGNLRRTRFVCMETSSQRTYLISGLAQVKHVKDTDDGE